jgi:hypothetical protein
VTTPGELAEIFHAGWAAVPHSKALPMAPNEAVVTALQAMERKAREFQGVYDMEARAAEFLAGTSRKQK